MNDRNRALLVGKEHAADRLARSQKIHPGSVYLNGEPPPTPNQIGAVLHALADHTLIEAMLHAAAELGADRAHLGEQWATATGLGRYLQRMGDWIAAHTPPSETATEECEDGVFGSQDIADALGGRGPLATPTTPTTPEETQP